MKITEAMINYPECHASTSGLSRRICRNNCRYWSHKSKKCMRGIAVVVIGLAAIYFKLGSLDEGGGGMLR